MNFRDQVDSYYESKNTLSHEQSLAQAEKIGWQSARKVAGIWAKPILEPVIIDTKEGPVQVTQDQIDKKSPWLSSGVEGEKWPQDKENIDNQYNATGKKNGEWLYFEPNSPAIEAAQIQQAFNVKASWGLLSGKKDDWIIRDPKNPKDTWIVDQAIFAKSYKTINNRKEENMNDTNVVLRSAKTRGGKWFLMLIKKGTDYYTVTEMKNGDLVHSTSVRSSEEEANKKFDQVIRDSAQYDGINYVERKDTAPKPEINGQMARLVDVEGDIEEFGDDIGNVNAINQWKEGKIRMFEFGDIQIRAKSVRRNKNGRLRIVSYSGNTFTFRLPQA